MKEAMDEKSISWHFCTDPQTGHSVLMAQRDGVWRMGFDRPKPKVSEDIFSDLPIRLPGRFLRDGDQGLFPFPFLRLPVRPPI